MRRRVLGHLSTAVACSSLALFCGLTAAQATRTVTIASHVAIKSTGLTFSGNVSASNAACKRRRKVTLYRAPSLVLGSTTTRSSGSWKITVSGSAGITLGHFYAKVKARSEGTAGTIYTCKRAASKTIPYAPIPPAPAPPSKPAKPLLRA
jgi:hypothetical protein